MGRLAPRGQQHPLSALLPHGPNMSLPEPPPRRCRSLLTLACTGYRGRGDPCTSPEGAAGVAHHWVHACFTPESPLHCPAPRGHHQQLPPGCPAWEAASNSPPTCPREPVSGLEPTAGLYVTRGGRRSHHTPGVWRGSSHGTEVRQTHPHPLRSGARGGSPSRAASRSGFWPGPDSLRADSGNPGPGRQETAFCGAHGTDNRQ